MQQRSQSHPSQLGKYIHPASLLIQGQNGVVSDKKSALFRNNKRKKCTVESQQCDPVFKIDRLLYTITPRQ